MDHRVTRAKQFCTVLPIISSCWPLLPKMFVLASLKRQFTNKLKTQPTQKQLVWGKMKAKKIKFDDINAAANR